MKFKLRNENYSDFFKRKHPIEARSSVTMASESTFLTPVHAKCQVLSETRG